MLHYNKNGRLCNHPKAEKEVCKAEDIVHSLEQTLWPDHAVMNTPGAEFSAKLLVKDSDLLVRKGYNCEVCLCGFVFLGTTTTTCLHTRLTPILLFMTMEALQ